MWASKLRCTAAESSGAALVTSFHVATEEVSRLRLGLLFPQLGEAAFGPDHPRVALRIHGRERVEPVAALAEGHRDVCSCRDGTPVQRIDLRRLGNGQPDRSGTRLVGPASEVDGDEARTPADLCVLERAVSSSIHPRL